jgi:hypothetical protein
LFVPGLQSVFFLFLPITDFFAARLRLVTFVLDAISLFLLLKISYMEAPIRFELMMEVLQTSALPLGYGAISIVVIKQQVKKVKLHLYMVLQYLF